MWWEITNAAFVCFLISQTKWPIGFKALLAPLYLFITGVAYIIKKELRSAKDFKVVKVLDGLSEADYRRLRMCKVLSIYTYMHVRVKILMDNLREVALYIEVERDQVTAHAPNQIVYYLDVEDLLPLVGDYSSKLPQTSFKYMNGSWYYDRHKLFTGPGDYKKLTVKSDCVILEGEVTYVCQTSYNLTPVADILLKN